ncbi:TPA: hypothetical protein ACL0BC_000723 [Streptococcus pneumoniae]
MRITDNQHKIIKEKFVEEYPKLSNLLLDRTLESLSQDERIFIFPNDLTHTPDLDKDQKIFETVNQKIKTGNVIGFLGYGQERLTISSVFSVGKRKVYPDFYDRERKIVLDAKYKKLELTEKGINREDLFQLISYSYILKAEKAGLIFPSMEQSVNSEIGKVAGYGAQLKEWSIRIPQNASFYSTFCKMMENSEENFKAIIDEEVGRK